MEYKNIKALNIFPIVYLGEQFKGNTQRGNQFIFKEKTIGLDLKGTSWECPLEDLIYIYIDEEDNLDSLPLESTVEKIDKVLMELLEGGFIPKVEIQLDGFLEEGNSIELGVPDYYKWLKQEIERVESERIDKCYMEH